MTVDNSEQIRLIEQRLAAGVSADSSDGHSTTFDSVDDALKMLERLKREDTTGKYATSRRVKFINLGGY